jgi:hypothetical protein
MKNRSKSKIIRISSVFPAAPDTIWPLLMQVETLRYIAAPYAAFSPLGGETLWREGAVLRFRLRIFGIPLGIHTISIQKIDRTLYTIKTFEGNTAVPVWNHTIIIEPVEGGARYTDEVEIGAGRLTGAVALWSRAFYRHRQKKWLKLLSRSGNPS